MTAGTAVGLRSALWRIAASLALLAAGLGCAALALAQGDSRGAFKWLVLTCWGAPVPVLDMLRRNKGE